MFKPIFWKKVPGQAQPGWWEIAEHHVPSIKVLFKTNTKSNKHPSSRLFIREQDTIGKPKKTKSGIQPRGAASPVLNDTPVVCIYMSYNRTHIKNAYIYVYIYVYIYILAQSFWTGTKVIRRKQIIQPTGFGVCSSTYCQWDGEDVPAPWERSNSHSPVWVRNSYVNQFI